MSRKHIVSHSKMALIRMLSFQYLAHTVKPAVARGERFGRICANAPWDRLMRRAGRTTVCAS